MKVSGGMGKFLTLIQSVMAMHYWQYQHYLEALNVDDDFLSDLKGAYPTCAYFYNDNNERRLRQKIDKSSDGLFRYHNRVVIPSPDTRWFTSRVSLNRHFLDLNKRQESRFEVPMY